MLDLIESDLTPDIQFQDEAIQAQPQGSLTSEPLDPNNQSRRELNNVRTTEKESTLNMTSQRSRSYERFLMSIPIVFQSFHFTLQKDRVFLGRCADLRSLALTEEAWTGGQSSL